LGQRLGSQHKSIVPYQAFPTADGYLVIAAANDSQFANLCLVPGIDFQNLVNDEKFASNQQRVKNREELIALLTQKLRLRTTKEWMRELEIAEVPYGPINNMKEVFEDPQVIHRKMIEEIEHPEAGKVKLVGIPVKYSENPASIRIPPPLLGEHTNEILTKLLGLSNEHIEKLRTEKVIL